MKDLGTRYQVEDEEMGKMKEEKRKIERAAI
jgi:hypothetical protein